MRTADGGKWLVDTSGPGNPPAADCMDRGVKSLDGWGEGMWGESSGIHPHRAEWRYQPNEVCLCTVCSMDHRFGHYFLFFYAGNVVIWVRPDWNDNPPPAPSSLQSSSIVSALCGPADLLAGVAMAFLSTVAATPSQTKQCSSLSYGHSWWRTKATPPPPRPNHLSPGLFSAGK